MRWIICTLLIIFGTTYCAEDESNEVIIGTSIKPPINLDSNLRKALLKALVELENEEKENHERSTRNDYVNIITHLDAKDKTVEKASASALSYFAETEPVNMTVTVKKTTSKPKHTIVIQKSKGTQHQTIYGVEESDSSDGPEKFVTSASQSFPSAKYRADKTERSKTISGGAQLNSVNSKDKTKKSKLDQTTTTTKPTSSTEESEANVESLQFFSAPLVAAFTVHQDDKGLPRKVVPIYNQAVATSSTTEQQLEKNLAEQKELQREVQKQQKELEARQEEELKGKQQKLEEEIKRLMQLREEQDKIIREQKLAYEQKLFEQQKKIFEQQTRLFNNVQTFTPVATTPRPSFRPLPQLNNNGNVRGNTGTLVAIQPSVGFAQPISSSSLPLNGQILPVRNAVNFRTPFSRNVRPFTFQNSISSEVAPIVPSQPVLPFINTPQNTLLQFNNVAQNPIVPFVDVSQNSVIPVVNFAQSNEFFQRLPTVASNNNFRQNPFVSQNFATSQSLPFATSQALPFRPVETAPQTHGTRTLRQESGTGNFLNNNRLNTQENNPNFFRDHRFNVNSFGSPQVSQPTQQFRTNSNFGQYNTLQYSVDNPFLNQRLNNLLLTSGLSRGRQEDFNIVSKVLSLNHQNGLGRDFQASSSNVDSRRTNAPANWRVV